MSISLITYYSPGKPQTWLYTIQLNPTERYGNSAIHPVMEYLKDS